MTELRNSPVFICGMPRSGTTLLLSLLDGHPELLAYAAESRFFLWFYPKARKITDPAARIALAEKLILHPFRGYYHSKFLAHIPYESVRDAFLKQLSQNPQMGDYLAAAVLAYGEASGQLTDQTKYWLDKTPWTERFTEHIFAWWKNARCIHVIRDPRDSYASWRHRAERGEKRLTLDEFAYSWMITTERLHRNRQAYGEDQYLCVRYEDLVQNPEGQMSKITTFLGIADHGGLYTPTKSGGEKQWMGNSSEAAPMEGIDPSLIGKWRQDKSIPPAEFAILEALVKSQMLRLGYQPEMSLPSSAQPRVVYLKALIMARAIRDRGQY